MNGTPQKTKAPTVAAVGALRGSESTDAGIIAPDADGGNDVFTTLCAALALRGFEARELPDGAGFVCGRWGLFRHCATLDELHAFAVRVGAC